MKEFIVDSYSMILVLATNNAMLVMLVVLLSLIGYKLSKFMGLIKNLVGLGLFLGVIYYLPINDRLNKDLLNLAASVKENHVINSEFEKYRNMICSESDKINLWEYKQLSDAFIKDVDKQLEEKKMFSINNDEIFNVKNICGS